MSERIGERHTSACRYKNEVSEGSRRPARRTRFWPRGVICCSATRPIPGLPAQTRLEYLPKTCPPLPTISVFAQYWLPPGHFPGSCDDRRQKDHTERISANSAKIYFLRCIDSVRIHAGSEACAWWPRIHCPQRAAAGRRDWGRRNGRRRYRDRQQARCQLRGIV